MRTRDSDFLLKFGNHFQLVRKKRGFTQEDLAYNTEISLSQIARIETGRINPTVCTLKILAQGMEVELKDLFDF